MALLTLGVLGLCAGCKRTPPPTLHLLTSEQTQEATFERERVQGPGRWVDPEGRVCLDLPVGWSGWRDPSEDSILSLSHPSGAEISLHLGPPPEGRDGYTLAFDDPQGSWRGIPALHPSSTLTWISEPGGPTLIEWYGGEDPILRVTLHLPWGRTVPGRLAAESLLRGLCRP